MTEVKQRAMDVETVIKSVTRGGLVDIREASYAGGWDELREACERLGMRQISNWMYRAE